MIKNLFFDTFLSEIPQLGIKFYIEEDDEGNEDEPILLVLDDFVDCAIEVDPGLGYMNVYMVFPYYDASKSEIETGNYFEEIESDTEQYLRESIFKSFLQNNIPYMVTDWDDGCYMCPGYTARVGLYHVPCDAAVIKSFFDYTKVFYNTYDSHDSNMLCEEIVLRILNESNLTMETLPFHMTVSDTADLLFAVDSRSIKIYQGHEYTLLSENSTAVAVRKDHWDLAHKIIHACELYDDTKILINKDIVTINSNRFTFKLDTHKTNVAYLEELYLEGLLSAFAPFASPKMKQAINSTVENPLTEYATPLIFTEGHTDWKHMKHVFSYLFGPDSLSFQFREYPVDTPMGSSELLSMCKSFAKDRHPAPRIMIFDCDVQSVLKEVSGPSGYKYWGNRVYSLALPIPLHRQTTPHICIEHYYTDDEIRKEFLVSGEHRRLHIGYEFDRFGRAPQINRICHQLNSCGPGKINIIDTAVWEATSKSEVNFALSKSAFAHYMSHEVPSETACSAFRLLYDVIMQIIEDDRKQQEAGKAIRHSPSA